MRRLDITYTPMADQDDALADAHESNDDLPKVVEEGAEDTEEAEVQPQP